MSQQLNCHSLSKGGNYKLCAALTEWKWLELQFNEGYWKCAFFKFLFLKSQERVTFYQKRGWWSNHTIQMRLWRELIQRMAKIKFACCLANTAPEPSLRTFGLQRGSCSLGPCPTEPHESSHTIAGELPFRSGFMGGQITETSEIQRELTVQLLFLLMKKSQQKVV